MATAAYKALKKRYNFIFYMTVSTCKSFFNQVVYLSCNFLLSRNVSDFIKSYITKYISNFFFISFFSSKPTNFSFRPLIS